MNDPLPPFDVLEQREDERTSPHEATEASHENSSLGAADTPWFWGASDRGKVRENNEDQLSLDGGRNLFIVADGMGGHAAGEIASFVVVEALSQWLTPQVIEGAALAAGVDTEMGEALRQANTAVMRVSQDHPQWRGMGSTAVIALLHGHALYVANVGDSRAYLLRSGVLQMLSQDHSIAAALAERNHISHEEIRTHPLRNRLTVCLGIEERIECATSRTILQPGDRVLLCSDGLWDMLPDQEITRLWSEHAGAKDAAQALIDAANAAGGQDNITVVTLHLGDRAEFLPSPNYSREDSAAYPVEDTVVVDC